MGIETVRQRAALAPRREPYWQAVGTGQHVGYRRTGDGGSWIARHYDPATGQRVYQALGALVEFSPGDQYTEAIKRARKWFDHVALGGRSETLTVADAWVRYIEHQRKRKGAAACLEAEGRCRRHVLNDPIAGLHLAKLAHHHVQAWRDRIAGATALPPCRGPRCRNKAPLPPPRAKLPASVNRDMAPMRAALNLALRDGFVASDMPWRRALEPMPAASGRRTLYLPMDQRRALVAALPGALSAFVHGLCLLPLRPGALALLKVAELDSRAGTLTVPTDKAGAGRKLLLPKTALDLLRAQSKNKLPAAPLFAREDGHAWAKESWGHGITKAVTAAGLPAGTTAYTLRHSTITDLVAAGLDLFTVAALSGTSVAMIEKHYGHLQQDRARDALAGLAL